MYRVSSSVKVKQMEAELSHQLAALRAEIEENGFPRGAGTANSYSSVPPPKDVSFFRLEREHALRRELQVAEASRVQSAADVMQEELQSCWSLEYSPENLLLLLHQFFMDRSYHLAQIKYQLMLRWRRFCRHTGVIEKLYPHYKVTELEYNNASKQLNECSCSDFYWFVPQTSKNIFCF
ncbi:putative uncharacterized protein C6orf183 isoform X3 [Amphiprion ocellaris]|uniref:putative uncharacterized protein C6orf183 isoform X3 n=1 Tax=Amphiprion ocellaris TaxID=80972 RepID=UPI002410BE4F|nr:putative uncharacterized protein C6orf183 isoform X3 [Amphiprion ocellaris]XP_054862010.1 putative uncharacterized protein C6orf183 isoform X3 [Amphiprion ocellaris]